MGLVSGRKLEHETLCKYWDVLCASFSSNYKLVLGRALFEALLYKVVNTESALCKLCSTKQYRDVPCASFVVQYSTETCFVQILVLQISTGRCCAIVGIWDVLCPSFVVITN